MSSEDSDGSSSFDLGTPLVVAPKSRQRFVKAIIVVVVALRGIPCADVVHEMWATGQNAPPRFQDPDGVGVLVGMASIVWSWRARGPVHDTVACALQNELNNDSHIGFVDYMVEKIWPCDDPDCLGPLSNKSDATIIRDLVRQRPTFDEVPLRDVLFKQTTPRRVVKISLELAELLATNATRTLQVTGITSNGHDGSLMQGYPTSRSLRPFRTAMMGNDMEDNAEGPAGDSSMRKFDVPKKVQRRVQYWSWVLLWHAES